MRLVAVLIAVGLPLALAVEAVGKVVPREAEACGASGCSTRTARVNSDLPFELFGPTIESGRRTAPPASSDGPRYRIRLTTRPVPGSEGISLDYLPDAGYIHVLGEPGSDAGGALLNTGWVRLTPRERGAYGGLTAGLTPFGAEASSPADGDGGRWVVIASLVAAAALGALALLSVRRAHRRAEPAAD